MDNEIRQYGTAWEERKQTETQALLECTVQMTADQQGMVILGGSLFPSLPHWRFGLVGKEGVTEEQLRTMAAQIGELCDGLVAHFDYQPEGLEFFETDKWGLAILESDGPHKDV